MTFDPTATDGTADVLTVSSDTSSTPLHASRVPTSMPGEQIYFWSYQWQADELETLEDMEAGDYVEFTSDDSADAARWLLEPGEDDE